MEKRLDHPLEEGTVYRCSVEGCHAEIELRRPPQDMEPTQLFVDCCGHQMEKVSTDEPIA
jgi:hypothetical protein